MGSVLENIVLQGILNNEENPAIDSDRLKASVVDAGSTDFGGSQKHDVANQAGAGRMARLALTASQKKSDEEGGGNQASTVQVKWVAEAPETSIKLGYGPKSECKRL